MNIKPIQKLEVPGLWIMSIEGKERYVKDGNILGYTLIGGRK